ncbi:MAG TPA: asparagine synthetase B, partial [Balneola sp.]|nr:asparagine synthetase B [Balneola sp.]
MLKKILLLLAFFLLSLSIQAQQQVLIPMDASQTNHLKAYGVVFNHITDGYPVKWLLNYRGGSFLVNIDSDIVRKSRLRNVSLETVSDSKAASILQEVERPGSNTSVVNLEKAPKIAVYTPDQALPWDDAVTLALTYAEVEYDKIWDVEVLEGKLKEYDWLHLHHEDFTGQFGKFWASYNRVPWYITQVRQMEAMAKELGYSKVSEQKKAVARTIKEYVGNGGFLFAMCSGTDTFDIALAAEGIDIAPSQFDGG